MALRRQEATHSFLRLAALVWLFAGPLAPAPTPAQNYTFAVRHRHWPGGAEGTLRISPISITFEEAGKNGRTHSRQWRYEQIQQLTLARDELRILTYEDSNWKLGRDREYVFDRLPVELASQIYPLFSHNLDQRFIAALPDLRISPEWRMGAKLTHGTQGTLGTLIFAQEKLIFNAGKRDDSRTWRISDIKNISTSGPFDLTLTTNEKSGLFRGGMRQFHFQLQSPLSEDRYTALWRDMEYSKGLRFLDPEKDDRSVR